MHADLVEEIVKTCRQRLAEGDQPSVKAPAPETLEDAVIELAQQRDAARERCAQITVRAIAPDDYCPECLGPCLRRPRHGDGPNI